MKIPKLVTAFLGISASIIALPFQAKAANLFDSSGLQCIPTFLGDTTALWSETQYRPKSNPVNQAMWNADHKFEVAHPKAGDSKIYIYGNGDVVYVSRFDEGFLHTTDMGRIDLSINEQHSYIGNLQTQKACSGYVSVRDRLLVEERWNGEKFKRWAFKSYLDQNRSIHMDFFPGTSCRYIYKKSSLKEDKLIHRNILGIEPRVECRTYYLNQFLKDRANYYHITYPVQ
jgi:hypothetical protein